MIKWCGSCAQKPLPHLLKKDKPRYTENSNDPDNITAFYTRLSQEDISRMGRDNLKVGYYLESSLPSVIFGISPSTAA